MSRLLRRRLPLGDGETPQSLASRLARRHGVATQQFCFELGFSFRRIVHGRPEDLAGLAEVAGVQSEALTANAFVDENAFLAFRGERLLASQVRRHRMRFCPHCLRHDIASGDGWRNGEASVHGRAAWLIEQVRTCPVHSVALVTMEPSTDRDEIHDVARRLAPVLPDLDRIASEARGRQLSTFEAYLLGRLAGRRDSAWLDGLSLHVAIMACAGLGMVEACPEGLGKKDLTDDGCRLVEAAGFDVAREGVEGIEAFMERVHLAGGPVGNNVARNWGRLRGLVRFFDTHQDDEAFRPAYEVIARFMADHRAIEGRVLGVTVRRRLHSLATASKETGWSPKALRQVLGERGLLPDGHRSLPPASVMVDADKVSEVLSALGARWGERRAADHLSLPVHQVQLLAGDGVVPARRLAGTGNRWVFDRADVERFLADVMARVDAIPDERPGWLGLGAASEAVGCPQAWILRMVVERRLEGVGRLASCDGLMSLRLDPEEIRVKVPWRDLSRLEAARMIGVSRDTMGMLKAAGHVRVRDKHGDGRPSKADFFVYEDLVAFTERYITRAQLCDIDSHAAGHGGEEIGGDRGVSGLAPGNLRCRLLSQVGCRHLSGDIPE
ncbi:TniQ family protein [Lichenibacterium dinghuense]|uniref:TniQ family protein n=1 Tax=Lichenibacterium dinghuense TaxID=2895977 RepID=UPI001F1D71B4|nr:TniQ family protein [Lichenibacterium sp. 6Y81]